MALAKNLLALSWKHVAIALGAWLLLVVVLNWLKKRRRLSTVPGPMPLPIAGNIPSLLKEPWLQFARWHDTYGIIYKFFVWDMLMVSVSDPDAVKSILQTDRFRFPKDDWSYKFFKPILGGGLVTSEGEHWKRQRTVLAPAFHYTSLARLTPIFVNAAERLVQRWAPVAATKGSVELGLAFRTVTLEVISEVALGLSPADANVLPRMFEAVLDELNTRMFQPWRAFLPVELVYRQHLGRLNALVQEVIETRRATWAKRVAAGEKGPAALVAAAAAETAAAAGGAAAPAPAPAPASAAAAADEVTDDTADGAPTSGSVVKAAALGGDMLDMMLGCGEEMSDAVLADELKTMLLAGHETSSMMLLWSCYLLCKHPDKMARAVAEVDAALGWPSRGYGSFEAYKGMAYLEQVMFEAMRLYSPVPVLTRETTAEVELCGQRLPPGTCIAMSVWALHRNPAIWGADADQFRPERFSPEETRVRHPFAYMPFSLGPRNCIGRNLALIEAKVVLATVLQRFQLRVSAGQKDPMPTDCYVIPVRPEGGLYMDVAVRTA